MEMVKTYRNCKSVGFYDIKIKFASLESGGKTKLELNDTDITGQVSNWKSAIGIILLPSSKKHIY